MITCRECREDGLLSDLCGDMPHVGATATAVESLAVLLS